MKDGESFTIAMQGNILEIQYFYSIQDVSVQFPSQEQWFAG